VTTTPQRTFDPSDRLPAIAARLSAEGIPAIVLRCPGSLGHPDRCLPSTTRSQIELLIRRTHASSARTLLREFDWRFELGGRGMWRAIPKVSYLWDDLVGIDLLWGVPSAPFAFRDARALEARLWARARVAEHELLLAHPDDVAVFGAVQASRPGRPQKYDAEDLALFAAGRTDWDGVIASAAEVGLAGAAERGSAVAGIVHARRSETDLAWRVADVAWRRLRPKRLRGVIMTGTPRLGRAITRSRFAGDEFLSGYGVFLPRGISEALAAVTSEAMAGKTHPVIVEVGTGCGAVGLAIAARLPQAEVHAVDTSRRALWWARINRPARLTRRVRFHRGSLLEPVPERLHGRVHAIAANVPYVPPALWGEGWTSRRGTVIGSGDDGLGLYRSLLRQARNFLEPGGRIVFQLGRDQWTSFAGEILDLGYEPGDIVAGSRGDVVVWATWTGGGLGNDRRESGPSKDVGH
jgi:methylase of polypeptide subunit release factors